MAEDRDGNAVGPQMMLRVRELEEQHKERLEFEKRVFKQKIAELEQDGKRLDFITEKTYSLARITLDEGIHWDVIEVGACKCMGRGKTPRQAIDTAMAEAKGE